MADCLYIKVSKKGDELALEQKRNQFNHMVEADEELVWFEDVPDELLDLSSILSRHKIKRKSIAEWIPNIEGEEKEIRLSFELDSFGKISIPFDCIRDSVNRKKIFEVAAKLESKIVDPYGIEINDEYLESLDDEDEKYSMYW